MNGPYGVWLGGLIAGWLVVSASAMPASDTDTVSGSRRVHVVQAGESLSGLGARFGIEPRVLARLNFLPADTRLRTGQWIVIDDRHIVPAFEDGDGIVVNVPQRMLFRFADGALAAAYPAAAGHADSPTFRGGFTVTSLETDPVWDVPLSIQEEQRRAGKPVLARVPPGPGNPLGKHWIGLDRPSFGIHGTNAPSSIFGHRTHGCIRLHPDDIAALFSAVCVGTRGWSIYQPVLLAETGSGTILFEAHPDVYGLQPNAMVVVGVLAAQRGLSDRIDWALVAEVLLERDGTPVDISMPPWR